jgi:hypothetical protein
MPFPSFPAPECAAARGALLSAFVAMVSFYQLLCHQASDVVNITRFFLNAEKERLSVKTPDIPQTKPGWSHWQSFQITFEGVHGIRCSCVHVTAYIDSDIPFHRSADLVVEASQGS